MCGCRTLRRAARRSVEAAHLRTGARSFESRYRRERCRDPARTRCSTLSHDFLARQRLLASADTARTRVVATARSSGELLAETAHGAASPEAASNWVVALGAARHARPGARRRERPRAPRALLRRARSRSRRRRPRAARRSRASGSCRRTSRMEPRGRSRVNASAPSSLPTICTGRSSSRSQDSLGEGGVLIYETFMIGNERFGRPSNPDFLLRPGS